MTNIFKVNKKIKRKKDLLEFLLENSIEENFLRVEDRTYVVIDCTWCGSPHLKRKDTLNRTKSSFCNRWCESRYKSSDVSKPRKDIVDDLEWFLLREKAWDRDNETCQNCGKPKGVLNRKPEVTIIDPQKEQTLENVVCLCLDCRRKLKNKPSQLRASKESDVNTNTDMFLCPHDNCSKNNPDSWFDTKRAMKIHYGSKHSGSISKVKKECKNCQNSFKDYKTRNRSRCSKCKLKNSDYNIETCHNCDQDFLSLGQHWASSDCDYPDIDRKVMEILTGMLMGDATVYNHKKDSEKCSLKWSMINEEFMKWLDKNIGYITLGKYEIYRTPEESARGTVQSGLAEEADPKNYNTMYRNMTRTHPDFNWFGEWYDKNGNKKFPLEEIELTPLTLKVWYICDGNLSKGNPTHRPRITCTNEKDRIEEIVDFIEDESGLNPYGTSEGRVLFGSEESEKFFDYVGEPLPGFEYKWP